jgi:hypothetical protein
MPSTYDKIAAYTVPSAQASYTFTSIPSTYTDLVIIISGTQSADDTIGLQFNSDTAANYSTHQLYTNGSGASSSSNTSSDFISIAAIPGTNQLASVFNNFVLDILNKTPLTEESINQNIQLVNTFVSKIRDSLNCNGQIYIPINDCYFSYDVPKKNEIEFSGDHFNISVALDNIINNL